MKKSHFPLLLLSVLALSQVMCATITIENQSGEEASVQLTVASGGSYSGRVPPGGSNYWTVSRSGPYTVSVMPFEPYKDLILANRKIAQRFFETGALDTSEMAEFRRLQLNIAQLFLSDVATSCSGKISEISEFVEDDFENIFVTISYDQQTGKWNAACG